MRCSKRKLILPVVTTLVILLIAPSPASAWNASAHQIMAWIAYEKLERKYVRPEVDRLLRQHPDYKTWRKGIVGKPGDLEFDRAIFMQAAIWPDDLRIKRDPSSHPEWHFIDLAFTTDNTPMPQQVSSPNIVEVIARLGDEIGNPDIKIRDQAIDLAWLIHLVGDVHQPLHCTTRFSKQNGPPLGDLGGNLFKISDRGVTISLHAYWDSLLGSDSNLTKAGANARSIMQMYPSNLIDLSEKQSSEEIWAKESFALAREVAYRIAPTQSVNPAYAATAKTTARRQIAIAGYRLAELLNQQFGV